MLAKVMNYYNDKINIVMCCYGKILVNVAAYVIPGYVCARARLCMCVCVRACVRARARARARWSGMDSHDV